MIDVSWFVQWSSYMITTFGYIGIIIASFVSSAFVLLPTFPLSAIVVLSVALKLNPILIALCAGLGSATGELIGYYVGRGGEKVILKKHDKEIRKIEKLFEKYRGGVVIAFFSFLPIIPVDVMGIFSGTIKYSVKKFYIACLIGKILRYLTIAFASYYGISFASGFLGTIL